MPDADPAMIEWQQQMKALPPARAFERPFPPNALRGKMTPGYFPDLSSDNFFKQRLYTLTFACFFRTEHWVL